MDKALVSYQGADVCAWEQEGRWTVQLGAYEASARYLDLALSELLGSGEGAHELAARLVSELTSARSAGADEAVAA